MTTLIGIYGAGQLGAYLCQAARSLGFKTTIVAPTADSPAIAYVDRAIIAPHDDAQGARELVLQSDYITYEIENVPEMALKVFERAAAEDNVSVAPSCGALQLLQNKHSQKQWLVRQGFPSAQFIDCVQGESIANISDQLGLSFVQKTHRGGYDGRGVQIIRDPADDQHLFKAPSIAERYIGDRRELAVMVARSLSGETAVYPVVEMEFDNEGNVLRHALCPARLEHDLVIQAQSLGRDIVTALNGVGLFTVEMFLCSNGDLLINEIAPRVHNAGHLTLEAHVTSQYEQHLRAITGLPLGSCQQVKPAAMLNILYDDELASACSAPSGVTKVNKSTYVHWYGKKHGGILRKMGHITSVAEDLTLALSYADAALSALKTQAEEVA